MMNTNYSAMTNAQLLEEKCYLEQIGFAGETFILDIMEELASRRTQPVEPATIKRDKSYKASNPQTHYKYKKEASEYGYTNAVQYPTDLMEINFQFVSYPGAFVTVVYTPDTNKINKIVCSGTGSRGYTQALKSMGKKYFEIHMN
jgi:hypothetical protein